jgi:hypothetical protein
MINPTVMSKRRSVPSLLLVLVFLSTATAFAPLASSLSSLRLSWSISAKHVVGAAGISRQNHQALFFGGGGGSIWKVPKLTYIRYSSSSSSTTTALNMGFLPPGGGGQNNQEPGGGRGLGEIAGGVLTLLAVGAFFASPLGGLVFAVFNSFLALLILLPIAAVVGFNVWQYVSTQNGICPNCGAPVQVLKDEQTPSICFNCGSILQVKGDQIYLANLNNVINPNAAEDDVVVVVEETLARSWLDGVSGVQRPQPSSSSRPTTVEKKMNNIIDVEVESSSDDRK